VNLVKLVVVLGLFGVFGYAMFRLQRFRVSTLMEERGLSHREAKRAHLEEDSTPDGVNLRSAESWRFAKRHGRQAEYVLLEATWVLALIGMVVAAAYL
jgi:hypothetical protein